MFYLAIPTLTLENGADDPACLLSLLSCVSAHLSAAADDLLVRWEVSSALANVLSDLETQHDLRRRATHDRTVRDNQGTKTTENHIADSISAAPVEFVAKDTIFR